MFFVVFFNDTATTEIYTLSLHDALPISEIQRVLNEILQLAEPDPSNPSRWVVRSMPNHKELAVWAGTVPETVAKAIGMLLETEVAKREFKTLHIFDRQRLLKMINE